MLLGTFLYAALWAAPLHKSAALPIYRTRHFDYVGSIPTLNPSRKQVAMVAVCNEFVSGTKFPANTENNRGKERFWRGSAGRYWPDSHIPSWLQDISSILLPEANRGFFRFDREEQDDISE